MWYMISSQDVENSLENRLAARPEHLARLQELADEGRLLVAGLTRLSTTKIRGKRALPVHW